MLKTPKFKPKRGEGSRKFNGNASVEAMYKTIEWRRFRKRFLEINPRCYCCGARSEVPDHLMAHKGDNILFEKPDNFIPLCSICHNKVTAMFDRHPVQKYTEKLQWLARCRITNDLSFKVRVVPYKY